MAGPAEGRGGAAVLLPLATAIFVFGTIYGAAQAPLAGAAKTIAASALVFSGVAQFTTAALLAAGVGAAGILATVAVANLRHVLLGAALRQRVDAPAGQRAVLSFMLLDETVGVALAARDDPLRRYVKAGLACGAAWVSGTVVGVAGGEALGSPLVAEAVFPVLFVGLAASTAGSRRRFLAAAVAMPLTLALAWAVPALAQAAPLAAAVVVALLVARR